MKQTRDTGRPQLAALWRQAHAVPAHRRRAAATVRQPPCGGHLAIRCPAYSDDNRLVRRDVRQRRGQSPGTEVICEDSTDGGHIVIVRGSALLILRIAVAAAFTVASVPSGKG